GQLRLGVDHPRDGVEADVAGQASDQLGYGDAFLEALVRQHRAAHAVAHGPDAVHAGVAVLVDFDLAALVELHAAVVGQQALGRGPAADGHQQPVDGDGLLALLVGEGDLHLLLLALAGDFGLRDLGPEPDVHALLPELTRRDLRDFGIGRGQEVGQGLEDHDLGTQALPDAAQPHADHAGADHRQAPGHLGEVEGADVVDDGLAVELRERQLDRIRACGDDDVGAGQLDLAAVVLLHLDHTIGVQGGEAVVGLDLVGLEQLRDAAGELLHDRVLAADHGADVDLRILRRNAVLREHVLQVVELARGVQQRLGRDAAHPQAGAAQGGLAVLAEACVDAGHAHAQLRCADRRVVAGGTGPDDDD